MDRRNFVQLLSAASCSYLVLRVTGCTNGQAGSRLQADDAGALIVYDLIMHGYFNPDRDYLGDLTQPLQATQIRDYKNVTLDYTQDDDGHTFVVGPEHFSQLLKGKAIEVLTTVNNGHNHIVRIDPADQFPGGSSVSVKLAADGTPVDPSQPPPPPSAQLFGDLSEADQPQLYVAASTDLADDSVQVCVAPAETCNGDQTLWKPMHRSGGAGSQIFVSDQALALDRTVGAYPFSVRGKAQSDGRLLTFLMKIISR